MIGTREGTCIKFWSTGPVLKPFCHTNSLSSCTSTSYLRPPHTRRQKISLCVVVLMWIGPNFLSWRNSWHARSKNVLSDVWQWPIIYRDSWASTCNEKWDWQHKENNKRMSVPCMLGIGSIIKYNLWSHSEILASVWWAMIRTDLTPTKNQRLPNKKLTSVWWPLRPMQTNPTLLANNSQHCWAQQCCDLLRLFAWNHNNVGTCFV